jgi:hypothetical protein
VIPLRRKSKMSGQKMCIFLQMLSRGKYKRESIHAALSLFLFTSDIEALRLQGCFYVSIVRKVHKFTAVKP